MVAVLDGSGMSAAAEPLKQDRAGANEKLLKGEPVVRKVGGEYEIGFALLRPADVTVRALDGKGKVIRHLASGVVGLEKAAKPLQSGSLSQTIVWDGKDNNGQQVAPAGAKVWVAAGLNAKFDRFILWEPDGIGLGPRDKLETAVIPAPNGEFYVTQNRGVHLNTTRVFNRKGRFVRCAWPFSLDRPKKAIEKFLGGKDGVDDWDGRRVPLCVNHNAFYYFGTRFTSSVISTDGYQIGATGYCMEYLSLFQVSPEGFPKSKGWKPAWHTGRTFAREKWKLAAGPEGDFYIADGLHHVVAHFRARDFAPINFRYSGTRKLKTPRPYIGEIDKAGEDENHFRGPDGISLDERARLLVVDGDAIKVYDKTGKFVEKRRKEKSGSWAPPAALVAASKNPRALTFPHLLRVDPLGRLYVKNNARGKPFVVSDIDGKSFRVRTLPWGHTAAQGYMCVDAHDNWYISVHPHGRERPDEIWKFSPEGKRLRFGERDAIPIEFGERAEIKGIYVTPNGEIYIVAALSKWRTPAAFKKLYGNMALRGDHYNLTRIDVYGPDGTLKRKGLVRSQGINDVAVDREGNVYVIESTMWHGAHMMKIARIDYHRKWPRVFPHLSPEQKKLGKQEASKRFSLMARLLKFPPTGGVMDGEGGPRQLWSHAGVSGLSPWNCGAECPAGQICLDPDERIWIPDTFLYNIKAVDKAGNLILRLGTYGNEECKGGGGDRTLAGTNIVIDPEIPLARPSGMAVYKDYLFISDMYAHRVMRCRLTYSHTRECALPE